MTPFESLESMRFIVDRVNIGIFVVDKTMTIRLWNRFMAVHSGRTSDELIGTNLFDAFPELPQRWLEKKIQSVFMLKNFAFSSWEQRPYLFKFPHNRPATGGVDSMQQDCTFMPMRSADGQVEHVCITLQDATDASLYQNMLKSALAKLEATSRVDGLTQVFNRQYWESHLSSEFARVQRYGGTLSVILFDLDHFKHINDSYGHLCGDEVLKRVAAVVGGLLRDGDTLGRYGGEEFGIVLPNTEIGGASVVAERIRSQLEATPIFYQEQELHVTASLGVAQLTSGMLNYASLLGEADNALYLSKTNGRNRWSRIDSAAQ